MTSNTYFKPNAIIYYDNGFSIRLRILAPSEIEKDFLTAARDKIYARVRRVRVTHI